MPHPPISTLFPYTTLFRSYPFFQGQILWTGYKVKFLSYRRQERLAGVSRWTFTKKVTYLLDGMLAYSFAPIRMMSLAGCALDRKSTRLNSSHRCISYAVFC